jgi:hypothetical protein
MFVYLLIAAELGILYGVFWYLYIRQPRANKRISAQLWGSYDDPSGYLQEHKQAYESLACGQAECTTCRQTEALLTSVRNEYILDTTTNHYVQVPEGMSLLDRLATTVDRALSHLNVAP